MQRLDDSSCIQASNNGTYWYVVVVYLVLFLSSNCSSSKIVYNAFGQIATAKPITGNITLSVFGTFPSSIPNGAFLGGVVDADGYVWLLPWAFTALLRMNTATGSMVSYSDWPSGFSLPFMAFAGGIFDGRRVWIAPWNADRVVTIDTVNFTMQGYDNWPDGFTKEDAAFAGGIFDGRRVWLVPHNADRVISIDTVNYTMQGYSNWPSEFITGVKGQFFGFAFDGRRIWMAPRNANCLVYLDSVTGTMTGMTNWPSGFSLITNAFDGCVWDSVRRSVWLAPRNADRVIHINTDTMSMTGYSDLPPGFTVQVDAFSTAAFDGRRLWFVPFNADAVVSFDVTTHVMKMYSNWPAEAPKVSLAFHSFAYDGEHLYLIPWDAKRVIRLAGNGGSTSASASGTATIVSTAVTMSPSLASYSGLSSSSVSNSQCASSSSTSNSLSSGTTSAATGVAQSRLLSTLRAAEAAALGVVAAAVVLAPATAVLSGVSPGAGGVLLVALHAEDIARRVRPCRESGEVVEGSPIGSMFVDNPTQLQLPGEASLTGGTVIGNALLTYVAPLLLAAVSVGWRQWRGKAPVTVAGYAVAYASVVLSVSSVLQMPTVAASVSLLLNHRSSAAVCLGAFGVLLVLAPLGLVTSVVFRMHPVRGRVLMNMQHARSLSAASLALAFVTRRRSTWGVSVALNEVLELAAMPRVVLAQLLEGCHYPHSWVIVWDHASMVLQGLLTGVASTSSACGSITAASWCLFAVSAASVSVMVAVRPRSTIGDCMIDITMNVWTSVALLLAALGIEDSSGRSATAQAAVQMLWTLPFAFLRKLLLYQESKSLNVAKIDDLHKRCGGVVLQQAPLETLIRVACRSRRVKASP